MRDKLFKALAEEFDRIWQEKGDLTISDALNGVDSVFEGVEWLPKKTGCQECGDPGFGSLAGVMGGCNCAEMTREKKKQLIEKRRLEKEQIDYDAAFKDGMLSEEARADWKTLHDSFAMYMTEKLEGYYTKEECDQKIRELGLQCSPLEVENEWRRDLLDLIESVAIECLPVRGEDILQSPRLPKGEGNQAIGNTDEVWHSRKERISELKNKYT